MHRVDVVATADIDAIWPVDLILLSHVVIRTMLVCLDHVNLNSNALLGRCCKTAQQRAVGRPQ
jgi:hypothetical protein